MKCLACLLLLSCLVVADEEKVSFEDRVKNSKPLELKVDVFKKGDVVLKISLMLPEKPFLTEWFADGPRSLKVEDDKLQAWFMSRDNGDTVHAFKLPKEGGKLVYDETFGDKGIAPFDRKKGNWKPREDFGDWGKDVKTRPLGDLVGHAVSEKEHWLEVKTKDGNEVVTLGKVDGKSDICWLHNFCRYKDLVFLVDGNCRKIGVWTIKGEKVFDIDTDELGLDYPWVQSIDITGDGAMFLGFTQDRNNLEDRRVSKVTEAGFLRITGLDTIKVGK